MLLAAFFASLSGVNWPALLAGVILTAISSIFLGLLVAVSVAEVFEAQTISNFFRFPMVFLCGLFFPLEKLPAWLRPLSYALPPTYGADAMGQAFGTRAGLLPLRLELLILIAFCLALFVASIRTVTGRWIAWPPASCLAEPEPATAIRIAFACAGKLSQLAWPARVS